MKAHLHENGWTVIVNDFDLKQATQDEIDIIGCWLATNTVVVFRDQVMTVDEEIATAKKFGSVQYAKAEQPGLDDERLEKNKEIFEQFVVPGSNGCVLRVTGEENHKGEKGLFGSVSELDWHANEVEREDRTPLVWLRAVRGADGSITSWTNHVVAFQRMPNPYKKMCVGLKSNYKYRPYEIDVMNDVFKLENILWHNVGIPDYFPPLIYKNLAGTEGLFFSWGQIQNFEGMTPEQSLKIIEKLRDHILSHENNFYHHTWRDGDVVISEQWFGVHKRWPFEGLDKRVLHRVTFNFDNIDLSKLEHAKSLLTN